MRNICLMLVAIATMAVVGCAGMPMQDQQNMTKNAVTWGALGAAGSAGIAAATGHAAGPAAAIGGVAGALLGAANTPIQKKPCYEYSYDPAHQEAYEEAYLRERERLARQRERWERERARRQGRRDAILDDYYGR